MAYQQRERRYIVDYLKWQWPEGGWILNVSMGPVPDYLVKAHGLRKGAGYFKPSRPRVDAVMALPGAYYLIESKIRAIKTGIGELTFYRSLVPTSPDLPGYDGQPVICRLVIPWAIPWMLIAARANDIEVVVSEQEWIAEYVEEMKHYFTAEYREDRNEKMRLRKVLGVD